MTLLRCDCCGFEQELTLEQAYDDGWDAPPHFTGYVACPLCPAVFIVLPDMSGKHDGIHELWKRDGRPAVFTQETCVPEEDRIPPERLAEFETIIRSPDGKTHPLDEIDRVMNEMFRKKP